MQDSLEATGFEVRAQIIWAKDRFALSRGHYHWQHEPCWYAVRAGSANWQGDRRQSTVWPINAREDQGLGPGTQKPVACMQRPIENNSSPGQAVYEPFSGSGTTIIAAEITGRALRGCGVGALASLHGRHGAPGFRMAARSRQWRPSGALSANVGRLAHKRPFAIPSRLEPIEARLR